MNLAKLAIKRPTFITSIILIMLVVGVIYMNRMSVDLFPDVNFPFVMVNTVYPGAGPKEVETLISKILEEQISSISGLKNVNSISQDGVSIVFGEFTLETDPKYAEQQVKDKVAQVRNILPDDIKEPIIKRFDPSDQPVVVLSLTGQLPPTELYDLADTTVRNGLEQVANVGNVEIVGGTKREIHINLDRRKLKEYETSVSLAARQVAANSQNIPIGKVSQGEKELSFRSIGEFRSIKQIKDVVLSFFANDVPVTLDKVGTVVDSNQEVKTLGFLNGKSALMLNIYRQSGSNTVTVSDSVTKRIRRISEKIKNLPGNPQLVMVRDGARPIRMNIIDVRNTIFEGILLAILVVYLFLGSFRSTFITVIALPNSLVGAFIFMGIAGFSINMLTLMALSLTVGLLIDDAIVVRENIFRHLENGEPPIQAALEGTNEVRLAVIATTLTVIAVFLPVGFLQGLVGQFFKQFGFTVVFAMAISLFDALTTAPMLSAYMIGQAHSKKKYTGLMALIHAPAQGFEKVQDWMENTYVKIIRFTLRHKLFVLGLSLAIFISTLSLVKNIPKTFMPSGEHGEFMVSLQAEPGTSLKQMEKYAAEIDEVIRQQKEVEVVASTVGNANGESNIATFIIRLVPSKDRKRTTNETKDYLRKLLEPYQRVLNPAVGDIGMAGEGDEKPFNLILTGDNIDEIASIGEGIIEKIKPIPGLVDVDSNYKAGKPEFQVRMDPLKMEKLGVQSLTAGMELRGMVEGSTPAKYREKGLEYDIRIKLQDDQRDLSKQFDFLYVPNVNNQLVKLKNIADPVQTTGPSKIFRRNRSRYVMISGNLTKDGALGDITAQVKKIMANEKLPEGVGYEFIGQSEDLVDLFKNMLIAALLSIIFIYLVLASLYESIIIPLTIMLALPLALVGGLLAIFIGHQSLNIFTMIGFIMLLGLVAKNSILLVDYTQRLIRQGLSRDEALVKAGSIRLRPILMTTFALIAGMLPLALGLTEVGKFRQGMGVAVIGGLVSSTILTMVVIPAVFGYMDRLRLWTRKLIGRPELREIDKEEAGEM
ncbi:MAG: efflux RND transporter permease subunit [Elusimicrobiota bacterium]